MATRGKHAPVETPPASQAGPTRGQLVEYDEFIESQLRKTRSHVRGVDIAAGVMLLVAGSLGFFFVVALADHWLVDGGLAFWSRLLLLIVFLSGAGWWIGTQIAPLAFRRINPLYAAYTIERSRPTLKNALVNFLMFRSNPAGVHQKVLQAIEEQAATNLVGVPVESAVDRSRLIKLGYVLVGIFFVCALYALVSPKSPFRTLSRVAMPWADIAPSTQTTIDEISPGDGQAFRGQQVTVQARVQGLPDDGKVLMYYTTADRQIVDRVVEMNRPPDDYRYAAVLPAGDSALQQSLSYRIAAGDAVSRTHTIEVVAAPTIVVRAIEYKYPDYTGLIAQRIEHQGDIKALEGTEVTLDALANQDIGAAHVDFDCDRKLDLRMAAQQQTARAKFRLALGEDRQSPLHASYQLSFKNTAGQENPQPVRHQIEVTRDLAPEIQFVAPKRDEIDLPLNAVVDLEVVANDPDFALAHVKIVIGRGDEVLTEQTLLKETWRGQFDQKYRFQPNKLGLAAGDVVDYYAVAVDNKSPRPNQTETSRRRVRIVSPKDTPDEDQLAQNDRPQRGRERPGNDGERQQNDHPRDRQTESDEDSQPGKPGEPGQGDDASGEQGEKQSAEPGERRPEDVGQAARENDDEPAAQDQQQDGGGSGEQRPGQQQDADDSQDHQGGDAAQDGSDEGDQQPVPSDGTNDGDAFERILKHRRQQEENNPDQQQPPAGDEQSNEQGDDQRGNDGNQGSQQKPSSDSEADKDQRSMDGDRNGEQQRSGDEDAQQGDSAGGDEKSGSRPQQRPPDQPSRDQQGGQKQPGQQESDKQQSGDRKSGNQEQSGDQKPGEPQAGEKQQRDGQPKDPGGQQQGGQKSDSSSGDQQSDKDMPPQGGQQGGQSGKSDDGSQSGNRDQQSGGKSRSGDRSQQQSGGQQEQSGDSNDQQSGDEQGQGGTKQQPGERGNQKDQRKAGDRQGDQGTESQEQPAGDENPSGDQRSGKRDRSGAARDNNTPDDGTPQDPMTAGEGAQSKDDPTRSGDQKPQQDSQQQPDAHGGDGEQEKGESGAGQESNDDKGSPRPQDSSAHGASRNKGAKKAASSAATARSNRPATRSASLTHRETPAAIAPAADKRVADKRRTSRVPAGPARTRLPTKAPAARNNRATAKPPAAPAMIKRPTGPPASADRNRATGRRAALPTARRVKPAATARARRPTRRRNNRTKTVLARGPVRKPVGAPATGDRGSAASNSGSPAPIRPTKRIWNTRARPRTWRLST